MSGLIKVALAGIAGYGDAYLEVLLPKVRDASGQLVGVVDPLPQRCRRLGELRARGVPLYSNLQTLFAAGDVDLMMIATPIHFHSPQTCFALQRGANVLCEKPLAGSLADAMRMLHAQQKHARSFVAIGFQWSFSQAVAALKRDIIGGVLGRPIQLKSIVFFPRPRGYFCRNDWAGRIRMPSGEGVLDSPVNNATSHYLHNMLYLLGASRQTSAAPASVQAELYRANDIENYDTAAMRVRTECGAEILFYTTHATPHRLGPKSRFQFEKAVVEFDAMGAGQFIARFHDGRMKNYGLPGIDRHEKIWQSIDAVRSGAQIACGIEAALPHMLCSVAAQESAPIISFPTNRLRDVPLDGDAIVCMDGLAETMTRCYERGVLPAEAGDADWASAGSTVDLTQLEWSRRRAAPTVAVHA